MAKRGKLITLEGGEGAGKSSQMDAIADLLIKHGHKVITTREPGGTTGAEAVRHALLSGAVEELGQDAEAILFAAARSDHVETKIRPALEQGTHVICDRYFDSTRVYQGQTGNVDKKLLAALERIACEDAWPDLTLIIDIDPREGMKRAGMRREKGTKPDRFEKESLKLQKQRRAAYLEIAKQEPDRCVVIDGSGSKARVFGRIKSALRDRLDLP